MKDLPILFTEVLFLHKVCLFIRTAKGIIKKYC